MAVNVVQLNAGKRVAAWANLAQLIERGPRKPTVIILQENYRKKLPNGVSFSFQSKSASRRNRAQIFVTKEFADHTGCHLLTDFTDEDQVAVSLKLKLNNTNAMNLIICSTYFQGDIHRDSMIKGNLRKLADHCTRNKIELLWGCDANAHSTDWGCPHTDGRGEELAEFCIANNLELLNSGEKPTFVGNAIDSPGSIIDLTLASENIFSLINDWQVSESDYESDHKAIEFSIEANKPDLQLSRCKRRTCWNKFMKELGGLNCFKKLNTHMSAGQLDQAAFKLNDLLLSAYEKSSKPIPKHTTYRQTWYSAKLDSEKAERNRLQRLAQKKKSKKSKDKYIEARNKYNSSIKRAIREDFRKFTTRLEDTKDIARLQKILENGSAKQIASLEKEDGTYTRNVDETISELMKTHFPDCRIVNQEANLNSQPPPDRVKNALETKEIFECTETIKIIWAIDSFRPFKAPGEDDIFPAMLQKSKTLLAPILQTMFRASLLLGYIPISWRGALVTFIPKPGKDNYGLPKSYRPISLMSFILKLLEKLIDKKIRNCELVEKPLSKNQHAYRSGRSTETALHQLISKTEKMLDTKDGANLSVFLDIAGAFDNTATQTIIDCARMKGIANWTLEWIESMLSNRSVKPACSHGTMHIIPTKGCPQGACLSPLLWCLVVDSLLENLENNLLDAICFADDVTISVMGRHGTKTMYDRMNQALKIVERWCATTGLHVNPEKTQMVLFSKSKFDENKENRRVMFYGKRVKLYDSVKYLGIILDRKLTMREHIDNVVSRANRGFWAASIIGNRSWGAKPHVSKYIFEQIILARIFYGCIFFWHKASATHGRNGRNIRELSKIQRRAALMITGAMSSTPQAMLNAFLGLPPLEEMITQRAIECFIRLKQSGFWKGDIRTPGHVQIEKLTYERKLFLTHDQIPELWPTGLRYSTSLDQKHRAHHRV